MIKSRWFSVDQGRVVQAKVSLVPNVKPLARKTKRIDPPDYSDNEENLVHTQENVRLKDKLMS